MSLLKPIEIRFRRFLVKALARLVRRRRKEPLSLEFSSGKALFIRQDRIGDVLVSSPVFFALAQRHPKLTMDIVLSPKNAVAIQGLPFFRKQWVYTKRPLETLSLIRRIRREKYDVAVDLTDKTSATVTLFLLLSGARWTLGLAKENSYALDVAVPLRSQRDVHIVERIAELLRPFGINPDDEPLELKYMPADASFAKVRRFLEEQQLNSKEFIAVNISAGSDTRFWGVANYRALLELVGRSFAPTPVLVLFKDSDKSRAEDIARGLDGVHMAERFSFDEFAAAISHARLLITPDTAAVHLAAAFRVAAVCLFVQSDKSLRIWDGYKSPAENLVTDVDDLSQIPVQDVWQSAKRLWEKLS